jgi:HEPN domain-containing protein
MRSPHKLSLENLLNFMQRVTELREIQLEKVGDWNLFKFSEALQLRMKSLLEKKKADQLTTDEISELDAIAELNRIFTHVNAMLTAKNTNLVVATHN